MEQIQNNRVITDLYRENAQFPGIALDGSDVYLCWQRFVDRHDSLMASCRRGDEVVWEREISDGGEVLHPVILAHGGAIWYAWNEYARENWRILARCYRIVHKHLQEPNLRRSTGVVQNPYGLHDGEGAVSGPVRIGADVSSVIILHIQDLHAGVFSRSLHGSQNPRSRPDR